MTPIHKWPDVVIDERANPLLPRLGTQELHTRLLDIYRDPTLGPDLARAKNNARWESFANMATHDDGSMLPEYRLVFEWREHLDKVNVGLSLDVARALLGFTLLKYQYYILLHALNQQRDTDGDPFITTATFVAAFPRGIPTDPSFYAYNQLIERGALFNTDFGEWPAWID